MRRGRPKHDDVLTPREWEVLALLREGLTNEQIAARLSISHSGAKYHVSEILSKLGVTTREAAAAWRPEERALRRRGPFAFLLAAFRSLPRGIAGKVAIGVAAAGAVAAFVVGLNVLTNHNPAPIPPSPTSALGKVAYIQNGDLG